MRKYGRELRLLLIGAACGLVIIGIIQFLVLPRLYPVHPLQIKGTWQSYPIPATPWTKGK